MTSGFYENGVQSIAKADVDLENDDISILLIDSNEYTSDLNNDVDLTDIDSDAILEETSLSGKTMDGTTFRANDVTFESIATGQNADAVIVFKNAESDSECILIAYIDNAPEFPITTDGSDVIINWDSGTNGIFKL